MSEENKEIEYYDNTRVEAWKNCPRSYYFRHMRGWRKEGTAIPLVFGLGIHSAMDVVWSEPELNAPILAALAHEAFMDEWEKGGLGGGNALGVADKKRNPGNAKNIIASYILEWQDWLKEIEVLCIEQPFVVPFDDGVGYIGRWDKVYKDKHGHIRVVDHKTTSMYRVATKFEHNWLNSWAPNAQIDGYTYAALGIYGESVKGCSIDGILVHPKVRGFKHIPVQRAFTALDAWHFETSYWIDEIGHSKEVLAEVDPAHPYLECFPKKDTHCQHKYGVCGYHDICRYGAQNPASIHSAPVGFIEEHWNPLEHNTGDGSEPMVVGEGK